ncbi:unnamed protein product [Gongylonema pulchrum]|uniref:H/ACA ribonucleoprotein complex subunit n=1 Tax=Gongylonema pulchrum TaxID=637853 RepID=A0A183DH06_9BILA|nr:unnamed protein product [Gongylonema pulchrum]
MSQNVRFCNGTIVFRSIPVCVCIAEVGYFTHKCENDIVCHNTSGKIPHFNARIFFDNKEQIGSVDEIFGGLKDNGFTVKLASGLKASSFEQDQVLYIDPNKLLPIERFLPNGATRRGRGQTRGGGPGRESLQDEKPHFVLLMKISVSGGRGGRGGGGRGGFRGENLNFNLIFIDFLLILLI